MATQLNQNQFAQVAIQGMLDLRFNPAVVSAEVAFDESGDIVPGQAMKMVDSAGGVPKLTKCTVDTDDVFGFVNYNIKNPVFVAGSNIEVCAMRDNVMYMTASAAIARNAKVMIVVSGQKVATATSGKTIIGRALDQASADGDLIRVMIDLPGVAA